VSSPGEAFVEAGPGCAQVFGGTSASLSSAVPGYPSPQQSLFDAEPVGFTQSCGPQLMKVEIGRRDDSIYLYLKVHPRIEHLFYTPKKTASEVYKTGKQEKASYYFLGATYNEEFVHKVDVVRQLENKFHVGLFDYGFHLMREGRCNFSVLRTVGISKGVSICIDSLIPVEAMENWVKSLKVFVASVYKEYVSKASVSCVMNIEDIS
jgi:hypothetical protein